MTTAAYLAQRMEVSERTIYRDVADLQFQGVPIEGEAGVGYRLGAGFDLPPMMFTQDEAKALVASVRMAQVWLDPALAQGAQDALGKILSVLPVERGWRPRRWPSMRRRAACRKARDLADCALQSGSVQERRKVFINYRDLAEKASERTLRPLGCFYWGKVWTSGGLVPSSAAISAPSGSIASTYVRSLEDRFRR